MALLGSSIYDEIARDMLRGMFLLPCGQTASDPAEHVCLYRLFFYENDERRWVKNALPLGRSN